MTKHIVSAGQKTTIDYALKNSCDSNHLNFAWEAFDHWDAAPEHKIDLCVSLLAGAFREKTVDDAAERLSRLLGREKEAILSRLYCVARRVSSDKIKVILAAINSDEDLPPAADSEPGILLADVPLATAMLLWRSGYKNAVNCLCQLNQWRIGCGDVGSRNILESALIWLTGKADVWSALDRNPPETDFSLVYGLFDDERLINHVTSRRLDEKQIVVLLKNASDSVARASAEFANPNTETMRAVTGRRELERILARKFKPFQLLWHVEDPDGGQWPRWLADELLERFPDTIALAPNDRWVVWFAALYGQSKKTKSLDRRAAQTLVNPNAVLGFRMKMPMLISKEILLQMLECPVSAEVENLIVEDLIRRFPSSRGQSNMDRWMTWLAPESHEIPAPNGFPINEGQFHIAANWWFYENFAKSAEKPLAHRILALSRIPILELAKVLSGISASDLDLLLRNIDYRAYPQRWCFEIIHACHFSHSASAAFERICDSRTIVSALAPGRPSWVIEASARRLGVAPPIASLAVADKPSSPWIDNLLLTTGEDCQRRPCLHFDELINDVREVRSKLLNRATRNHGAVTRSIEEKRFARRLEPSLHSVEECYVASAGAVSGSDALSVWLNSPRHFSVKPGWRIEYGLSTYRGHHGEWRGEFITNVFTCKTNAQIIDGDWNSFYGCYDFMGARSFSAQNAVPVQFDLQGIDLPNTEEALIELAAILSLPVLTSVNPAASLDLIHVEPILVLGSSWSGLQFAGSRRYVGEGDGNWGSHCTEIFQIELVVIWAPLPILGFRIHSLEEGAWESRPPPE